MAIIYLTDKDDLYYAGCGGDTIRGLLGHDSIYGGSGYDRIFGGSGDDMLESGGGGAELHGGDGNDLLYGSAGADILYGENGHDVIFSYGGDVCSGGTGNDELTDIEGDSSLLGGVGADKLYLNVGTTALGGSGNDQIYFAETGFRGGTAWANGGGGRDQFLLTFIEHEEAVQLEIRGLEAVDRISFRLVDEFGDTLLNDAQIKDRLDANNNGWIGLGDGLNKATGWGVTANTDNADAMDIHVGEDVLTLHGVRSFDYVF